MISISSNLYKQCRGTFFRCSEFDDDDRLKAVFVVDKLSSFYNDLPKSRSKTERIEICIAYLIEKQFIENDFLLAVFILALRDHYLGETELWSELGDLYRAVTDEVNKKRRELRSDSLSQDADHYGELIEAPVERTRERDQSATDVSSRSFSAGQQKGMQSKKSLSKKMKRDFFISYNRHDKEWAEWIAWQLEDEGYTTVIQAWDFRPGSNFVDDMDKASTNAERTIVVLSPDYVESKFTAPEWNNAFAQDPTGEKGLLLPVKVRDFELDGLLQQVVYIDLVGKSDEDAKNTLIAGIKRERAKPTAVPKYPTESSYQDVLIKRFAGDPTTPAPPPDVRKKKKPKGD